MNAAGAIAVNPSFHRIFMEDLFHPVFPVICAMIILAWHAGIPMAVHVAMQPAPTVNCVYHPEIARNRNQLVLGRDIF